MCSFGGGGGGSSGPSAAEIAARNMQASSPQGAAQDVGAAAAMANQARVRRRIGLDSTVTGAGEGAVSGLGVGTKTGLGQ